MLKSRIKRTFHDIGYLKTIWYFVQTFITTRDTGAEYDTVVSLVPRHGKNVDHCSYGHWIAEDLPRLRGVEQYCQETGRNPPLLIKSDPPSWMRETLQLLGYSPEDWIEWDQEVAHVNRLIVPMLRYLHTDDYDPCPADKQWLRDRMMQQIDHDDDEQFSRYVLLSRQNTDRRRIVNYDAVMDVLESYGFEAYTGAELSVEEQIILCSNADIIIGANGSNMINVLWATDATVITLFPPNWFGIDSFMTANERGLDFDFIVGEQIESTDDKKDFEEDILVNIDRLETVVEQAT
jgi:capsular polysaccharide biosynthesis protein